MQTIVVSMDARALSNPDLDIRYRLPDRIAEITNNAVQGSGYDYIGEDGFVLAVWLETEDAAFWYPKVVELLKTETFCDNDLSASALVLVSEEDCADYDVCRQVYPEEGETHEL